MYSTLIGIGSVVAHMWTADLKIFTLICHLLLRLHPHKHEMHPHSVSANHISFAISAKNHAFFRSTHKSVVDSQREKEIGWMANNNNNFPISLQFSSAAKLIYILCVQSLGLFPKINYHSVSQSVSRNVDDDIEHNPFFFIHRIQHSALPRRTAITSAAGTHIENGAWNGLSMALKQTRRSGPLSLSTSLACPLSESSPNIPDGRPCVS